MKTVLLSALLLVFLTVISSAQTRPITAGEYNSVFKPAVKETNTDFPFIFTVTTQKFKDGVVVSTVTEVAERVGPGKERETRTTVEKGKTSIEYQIRLDFGTNFCSKDGISWKPTKYECFGPVSFYGPRSPESVEYSVEEQRVDGKTVKVYREYSVFGPASPGNDREFRERLATIDSRGFFVQIVDTEGTLGPRKVELVRTQAWEMKATIKPIVAPGVTAAQNSPADSDPILQGAATYSMPQSAIDAEIGGTVMVAIRVDETGKPTNAALVMGPMWPCSTTPTDALKELSSTLIDTMMKLRFTPAIKDGKAVAKNIGLRLELKNPRRAPKPAEIDPATGKPKARQISGGVLNGKATHLPKPSYPAKAHDNRDSGAVTIQVLIDEEGRVIRAGAVSGAATLQLAAREAACRSRFSPITLEGNRVKLSGVITYNFVP